MSNVIIDNNDRFTRVADAFAMEVDGHTVVIDRGSEQMLTLNEAGGVLWKRLSAAASVADLVASCLDQWPEAPREIVEEDVKEFLVDALDRGAVVRGD